MKEEVPDWATVPSWLIRSSLLIPQPRSIRVRVFASLSAISCDGRGGRAGGGDGELRWVGFGRRAGRHLHLELGGVAVPEHRVVSERQEPDLVERLARRTRAVEVGKRSAGGVGGEGEHTSLPLEMSSRRKISFFE